MGGLVISKFISLIFDFPHNREGHKISEEERKDSFATFYVSSAPFAVKRKKSINP
jgi:hypothetical protein